MKIFRDKNRGPKIKSEDVVIPEEYLEYEREAEARRQQLEEPSALFATPLSDEGEAQTPSDAGEEKPSSADAIANRIEEILNAQRAALAKQNDTAPAATADDKMPDAEKHRFRKAQNNGSEFLQKKPAATKKVKPKKEEEIVMSKGFFALLSGITVLVAAVVVLLGPVMAIDHVQVNSLKYMDEAQVIELAGQPVGENLFRYRTSQGEAALRDYPYVQDVQITRHWPHYIAVNITERQPAGVLLNNGNYLQFSKDGVLLDNAKSLTSQNLPLITGFSMDEVPQPGEAFKDNERFQDILKIVNACDDGLLTMIQEINIEDPNHILAYTSQGLEIRIGSVENIETRMAILNDIMNQVVLSNIIEESIEAIDIRYEKSPVIVLEGYDDVDATQYLQSDAQKDSEASVNDAQTDGADNNGAVSDAQTDKTAQNENGVTDAAATDGQTDATSANGQTGSDAATVAAQ